MLPIDGMCSITDMVFCQRQRNLPTYIVSDSYYMETPDEASWLEIQDKLLDEDFAPQLQEYLEDIAIQKIEIPL